MTNQPLLKAPQLLLFHRKNFLFEIFSHKTVIIMLQHLYDELFPYRNNQKTPFQQLLRTKVAETPYSITITLFFNFTLMSEHSLSNFKASSKLSFRLHI